MNAALILLLAASLSRTTFLGIDLFHEPGLTRGIFTMSGVQGDDRRFSRLTRDYDPSYMSVSFLGASREVPAWGVDTLTGSGGWPRSLMVAIPGLEPGMEVTWTFQAQEFGRNASAGLWFHWTGGAGLDTVRVSVHSDGPYRVHLENFRELRPGTYISTGGGNRAIWLASRGEWGSIGRMVLGEALDALAEPPPPDLREAVIQAGVAGASTESFLARARTLISDSFRMTAPSGEAAVRVRPVQAILDSRYASPLETAVVFCYMARLAGHDALLAAARTERPPFPYPIGWNRFLVRVDTPDGALWFEPSAPLSPAGYIVAPDTLFVLTEGSERVLAVSPNQGHASYCEEDWLLDPVSGTFSLTLDCRGAFDMELRGKLGGMPAEDAVLAVAEWFRVSGIHLFPTECVTGDFFDLSVPATLVVRGVMASARGNWCERAPSLRWSAEGERIVRANGSPISGRVLLKSE